jgi:hypothetical protein
MGLRWKKYPNTHFLEVWNKSSLLFFSICKPVEGRTLNKENWLLINMLRAQISENLLTVNFWNSHKPRKPTSVYPVHITLSIVYLLLQSKDVPPLSGGKNQAVPVPFYHIEYPFSFCIKLSRTFFPFVKQ